MGGVAGVAGRVNIASGAVIFADECFFHRKRCIEASVELVLSGATGGLTSSLQTSIKSLDPDLFAQLRFGFNAANTVGSVGIDQASAQSGPGSAMASPTGTVTPSSELTMRRATDRAFRQIRVNEAGRNKLEQVRAARQAGATR